MVLETRDPVDDEAIAAAAGAIEADEEPDGPQTVTISNGLILRIKPVPPYLVQRASEGIERPQVPTVYNEEKEREEENPLHPDYEAAVEAWQLKVADAAGKVMLGAGTEVHYLPDGMDGPDADGWIETVEYFGVTFDHNSKMARYITWLTCYALPTAIDLQAATAAVAATTGIAEGEVQASLDSFRNRAARRANKQVAAEDNQRGDSV